VVAEVALAVLLVGGAGLVTRSFLLMRRVDPGFQTEGVLAVQLTAPSSRYPARDDVLTFQERLLAALEARAGIERAGIVEQLPLAGSSWSSQFQAEGWPPERIGFEILHRRADAGYFDALGISLLRGRMFGTADGPDDERVVVINETFAQEHFPGEDAIGQRVAFDRAATADSRWFRIVGVVADQSQVSPAVATRAEVFENRVQDWGRSGWIVLRTAGEPLSLLPTVREALRELDPEIPLTRVRPLHEVWRASMEREEFILTLLSSFGLLALVLATVGVYGVIAQATRARTREIGIRVALGAESGQVRRLILGQGVALTSAGVGIGVLALLGVGRLLSGLLFGVAPSDPATLVGVALLLLTTALVASLIPAQRATRVDLVRSLSGD
jgi:predicted permease